MFSEVMIIDVNACSGCAANVSLSLKKRQGGRTSVEDERPDDQDRKGRQALGNVYPGNCLKDFQNTAFVPGCPFLYNYFIELGEKMARDGCH